MQNSTTLDRTAAILAEIGRRNTTNALATGCTERRDGRLPITRINFSSPDILGPMEAIKLRANITADAIIPAAKALGIRLQCGDISYSGPHQ
jgi:hypothetical protein